jgi:RNA polymerase sigma-70 factor (ECF subfamily)
VRQDARSDAELLALSRTRPEVFAEIYERHAPAVYRYLARRAGPAAAEDLLGEVFTVAVAARLRVQPHVSGSVLPWLYGVAGNVTRSYFRRSTTLPMDGDAGVVDWDAVDARLDATARRPQLHAALSALTSAESELLLLVAWEQLTPMEAADALGLTPVAARSRLHRARARAQAALDEMTAADR